MIFKRVMSLHYILNQDQDSLIRRVFEAQVRNPSRNDWNETVKKDLEELKIVKTSGIYIVSEHDQTKHET